MGAVILDVVNVEAELAESEQVMKQLPDDPRERVPRREMQHDDFALALAVHVLRRRSYPATRPCGYPLQLVAQLE